MEDTATSSAPAVPRPAPAPGDTARHQAIVRKRIAVVAGLLCVTAAIAALCVRFGPEPLAFVGDAPRFRAWVDDAGAMGRCPVRGGQHGAGGVRLPAGRAA